jgi:hypothetical protein
VACIGVKNRNDLRSGLPIGDVTLDELEVENGRRQISLERQRTDAEHRFHVR